MAINVIRGRQPVAAKLLFYGTEGVGKTTLASQLPSALILDTEDGSRLLDVARVPCRDFASLENAMHELIRDAQGFATVVVDSVDWAERSLIEFVVRANGKKSIEDFSFGRGYVAVAERTSRFLALADELVSRGINVAFVAHATVKRVSPPDQTDGYDRYELKLCKQTAPLFKEWADAIIFATYKMRLVEGQDGRKKGFGGRERIMFAERSAAYDAKNRFGLPAEMPMNVEALAPIFGSPPPRDSGIAETLDAIARATAAQLDRLAPRVEARRKAGELSEPDAATVIGSIERRRNELAGMVTA